MRALYHKHIPYEFRYWLYKVRHPWAIRNLRSQVFPSPKGDFSLRAFDREKCLFIHITKSAGTSVAKSLFGELPYHYTAIQYRVIFGRRAFNRYFKFAFVRNPWDRLYSAYSFLRSGGWNGKDKAWYESNLDNIPDFETFVMEWLTADRLYSHVHFYPQHHFVCDRRGRPLLDFLGYFETLADDFSTVSHRLGKNSRLAHANRSGRSDYRVAYSTETARKVAHLYERDIEHFGYDFDGVRTRMSVSEGRFVPA